MATAEQTFDQLRAIGLAEADADIAGLIDRELGRQRDQLELIASENFTWPAVLEAVGSVLTNKYAEGYPGRRYYGGCEWVDEVEQLAIDRAKALFGADHANVQPHAGGPANQAAYYALLEPGDPILGLRLDHGGHLTHGLKVNFSGRLYDVHAYGVRREDSLIDFDEVERLAKEYRPRLIVAGASAYPRVIEADRFRAIADEVGAMLMVDMAHFAGLVAAGIHPNPVEHADVVTSTTHKTLAGPRSGLVLSRAAPRVEKDDPKVRFQHGVDLFRDGDYRAAVIEFRRAYELSPNPRVLYNLGEASLEAQDYPAAQSALRRYLDEVGKDVPPARRTQVEVDLRSSMPASPRS